MQRPYTAYKLYQKVVEDADPYTAFKFRLL